jgi:hypothetical protein
MESQTGQEMFATEPALPLAAWEIVKAAAAAMAATVALFDFLVKFFFADVRGANCSIRTRERQRAWSVHAVKNSCCAFSFRHCLASLSVSGAAQ